MKFSNFAMVAVQFRYKPHLVAIGNWVVSFKQQYYKFTVFEVMLLFVKPQVERNLT